MEDDNNLPHLKHKKVIYWGLWLRVVMAIYIVTLPSCVEDASHFGPGFAPLIAAFLFVPIFGVIAFVDAINLYVEIIQRKNLRRKILTLIVVTAMLMGYGAVIAYVVIEKYTYQEIEQGKKQQVARTFVGWSTPEAWPPSRQLGTHRQHMVENRCAS
jgi:hypothetical protein